MPSHNHSVTGSRKYFVTTDGSKFSFASGNVESCAIWRDGNPAATANTGGGQAHNNMPPYQTACCWERIS